MREILELILFENENTRLDFKRDEYRKENYSAYLKDIVSMANAFTNEERYIIIGLKPKSINDRGFVGITGTITDSATFQQLVYENIEPEISIEYFSFLCENHQFGIFKISNCNNPPYLMKKDYGNEKNKLFRGEGFIRKGTHQTRLTRKDFDRYLDQKIDNNYFNEDVEFVFTSNNRINELKLICKSDIERPSQIKKRKIERILKEKKEIQEQNKKLRLTVVDFSSIMNVNSILSGTSTYEQRDIPTLEKNLQSVEQTYFEHDCYEYFEKNANKFNISIFNKGHNYIEDASILLKIPNLEGLHVMNQIYTDPEINPINRTSFLSMDYPKVTENEDFYLIEDSIGNIKHQMSQDAFSTQIRIFTSTEIKIKTLTINCELFAKNIKSSIKKEIIISLK